MTGSVFLAAPDAAAIGGNDLFFGLGNGLLGPGDDTIDGGPGADTGTRGTGVGSAVNCE